MIALTPKDFELVGQVASNCDNVKLQIAIREAIDFDLAPQYGSFWYDIEENWSSISDNWSDLVNGSSYIGCGGKTRKHSGLKSALIYFSYARYIILNGFNDTPVGQVTKSNPFSIPKPLKELQSYSEKYLAMAQVVNDRVGNYLCKADSTSYPKFDRCNCNSCGCAGECGNEGLAATRGFTLKSKNVSKWDV